MAALRLVGVGFFIGISIVLGVVAGLWLDSKFDTGPVLVIVGLILGLVFLIKFVSNGKSERKKAGVST